MSKFKITIQNSKLLALTLLLLIMFVNPALAAKKDCPEAALNSANFFRPFMGWTNSMEYWKDFERNYCQFLEIEDVRAELENKRELIRKAFYACNNDKVLEEKDDYQRLELELWYLRNFVVSDNEVLVKKNAQTLKNEMQAEFFGVLPEAQIEEYFNGFQDKYVNSFDHYSDCAEDVTFGDVVAKAKELFWHTIPETFTTTWKKEKEAVEKRREAEAKDSSSGGFLRRLYNEHVELGVNNKKPRKSTQELVEEFKKQTDFPEGTSAGIPFSEFLAAQQQEQSRFQADVVMAEKAALYKTLYFESSDKRGIDFERKLQGLNRLIKVTYEVVLKDLTGCVEGVNKRQCTN